jgi:hypothetical protein
MTDKNAKRSLESPWFTPEEAARYCKISLSLFNQKRRELPIKVGGTSRRPRFHKSQLDYWMERGFKNEYAKGFHGSRFQSQNNGHRVCLLK